jgi:hypothetical protein
MELGGTVKGEATRGSEMKEWEKERREFEECEEEEEEVGDKIAA